MPLYLRRPGAPLDACIDAICLSSDYVPAHALERILPDGRMTLVIRLDKDELRTYGTGTDRLRRIMPGAVLAGPYAEFQVIDTECQKSVLTVHFKPGGAYAFTGVEAAELRNLDAPAEAVLPGRMQSLRHDLAGAKSPGERLDLMEAALRRWFRPDRMAGPAVCFAMHQLETLAAHTSVAQVACQTGLSERRLADLFRRHVGLLPKAFARVRRFRHVLKRLAGEARRPEWGDVAFDCGFFDQAHFIHDFRAFCGLTPEQYLARRGEHLLHLPLN